MCCMCPILLSCSWSKRRSCWYGSYWGDLLWLRRLWINIYIFVRTKILALLLTSINFFLFVFPYIVVFYSLYYYIFSFFQHTRIVFAQSFSFLHYLHNSQTKLNMNAKKKKNHSFNDIYPLFFTYLLLEALKSHTIHEYFSHHYDLLC